MEICCNNVTQQQLDQAKENGEAVNLIEATYVGNSSLISNVPTGIVRGGYSNFQMSGKDKTIMLDVYGSHFGHLITYDNVLLFTCKFTADEKLVDPIDFTGSSIHIEERTIINSLCVMFKAFLKDAKITSLSTCANAEVDLLNDCSVEDATVKDSSVLHVYHNDIKRICIYHDAKVIFHDGNTPAGIFISPHQGEYRDSLGDEIVHELRTDGSIVVKCAPRK